MGVTDRLPGGAADFMADERFDPVQLARGIEHELEHTADPALAKEIAKDHLIEHPDYYTRLERMEREAEMHPNRTLVTQIYE